MAISFNQVPIDLRVPGQYIEIDNTQAVRGLPGMPSRILVLGQMLTAGAAAPLTPIDVLAADQAAELFGRGSMLHRAVRALKAANRFTKLTVIALQDDPAGAAAGGSITFTGPATAAGTIALMIAGQRVRVGAAGGDSAAAIATATAAALNAVPDLPVTASVDGVDATKVNLTCRWKGESGNGIDIRHSYYLGEGLPAGVGIAVAAMSGGTANPDLDAAIAAMADTWYTDVVCPYSDAANLTALETEMARRFGPTVMQDGHVYAFASGTHATLTTLGNSRNSPHLSIAGLKGCPTPAWEVAAVLAGVCAYHARLDPARPFQTLPLPGVLAPVEADRFTLEERNLLLFDGIATLRVDDGGQVLIERVVTTYETNAYGIDDPSYLDLNTLKTLAYLRYSVRARIAMRFPRHKLASDGTKVGPGQAIVTPSVIRAELVALMRDWEEAGLAEGIDQF
jgi:phage tail sheath gpL-like